MADLAKLRIAVDSTDVRRGSRDLGAFSLASKGAAREANLLGAAVKALSFVAAYAGISKVLGATIQFGDAMAEVSTLVDTAVVSMDDLSRAAREQAIAFGSTAPEQANALYSIISAGAATSASAVSLLTEANKLAVGGVTDVATAADGLTTVVNAFGIASENAGQVSDALFVGMRAGKTTIAELSRTLGLAAPLASEMGVSVDELVGSVAALTKGGIRTSIAVQGMRAVLAAVAKPTKEAADTAKALGLEFNSAALQSKGLAGFLDDLREKAGGNQDELAKLFGGVEALVPVMALMGTAGQSFNEILEQMKEKSGAAAEAVEKMERSLGFKTRQASALLGEAILTLGDALSRLLIPALDWLLKNGRNLAGIFYGLAAATGLYAAKLALVNLAMVPYVATLLTMTARLGLATAAKFAFVTATTAATGAMNRFTLALIRNPFILVATALAGLVALIYEYNQQKQRAIEKTKDQTDRLYQEAAARGENYKQMRAELFLQKLQLQTKIADLRIEQQRNAELNKAAQAVEGPDDRRFTRMAGGIATASVNSEISQLQAQVDAIAKGIERADKAYGKAGETITQTSEIVAQAVAQVTDEVERQNDELERLKNVLSGAQQQLLALNETSEQTRFRELTEAAEDAAKYNKDLAAALIQVRDELDKASKQKEVVDRLSDQNKKLDETRLSYQALIRQVEHQNAALGLSGKALELHNLQLEEHDFRVRNAAMGTQELNAAWEHYKNLRTQGIIANDQANADIQRVERLREGLEGVFDILGRNGIGGVFSGVLRMQVRGDDNQLISLGDKILEGLGDLGDTFVTAIQYAAAGGLVGGAAGSKLGGSIGGAIGGKLGEKFLTKGLESVFQGLGDFAGPIGSIAGGLLGGVIGGMVKSTPRASATIETISGNAMVSSVRGSSGQLKKMAEGLAGSVVSGLQKIAEEFSGTIADGLKISIGVRKKTFRVDPLGLGRTKGMIAFDTEEEAIRYAIKLALERGAIEGIRQSTQNLLEAGDDLEAALQDAMDFEGVFDRLLEKTDPLTHGLKELDKEFERLNKIFEKAGATTEEYAELQRLYDLERADILKEEQQRQMDEANKINDLILRIYREQGKEAEELALTRKMERDAATEAERAILDQIYALEDFNKARVEEVSTLEDTIATMTQLAGSLRAFREGLYGADQSVINYKQALVDLIRVGSLASTGDVEALGQLQGVSQTFLASSKASARSLFDYQKDVALVASYVDQGIAAADEQVSAAEQQIDLLQQQLEELVNIAALLEQPTTPDVAIDPSWNANIAGGGGGNTATLPVDGSDMQAMLSEALYAIAKNTGNTAKLLDRWDGDGQPDIRELQSDYY
ncbi:tail tape measure protein [Synechococcus phage S-CBS4]|nr:tail tape measure protein [Synechococcus phage S-CBS4]